MVVADADSMNGLLQASRGQVEREKSINSKLRKKRRSRERELAMSAIEDMHPEDVLTAKLNFLII